MKKKPELLAPVGDFTTLRAAIDGGCDAIYFGVRSFNMRAKARNFTLEDLPELSRICYENNVKRYLTLNTIIYEDEIGEVENIIKKVKPYIDGIICWDLSVIQLCNKYEVPVHISTQASVSNHLSTEFYREHGAKRIVLARECSLEQIKKIKERYKGEVEVFIHGAMCVSVSGRCFLSQFTFGKSANRGECLQNCRREYLIQDVDREFKFKLGNNYVMSAKDLCTLPFIEKLLEAGIDSFKIEGRNRSPEYVKRVVEVYREAIDKHYSGELNEKIKSELMDKLKSVYNKGFSSGFYLGQPINEFSDKYGNKATTRKEYIGKVRNFYTNKGVMEVKVESHNFRRRDHLMVQGPTTGVVEFYPEEIMQNDSPVEETVRGIVTVKTPSKVRENDKVYVIKEND